MHTSTQLLWLAFPRGSVPAAGVLLQHLCFSNMVQQHSGVQLCCGKLCTLYNNNLGGICVAVINLGFYLGLMELESSGWREASVLSVLRIKGWPLAIQWWCNTVFSTLICLNLKETHFLLKHSILKSTSKPSSLRSFVAIFMRHFLV